MHFVTIKIISNFFKRKIVVKPKLIHFALFVERTVFYLMYVLPSIVRNRVVIALRVYIWVPASPSVIFVSVPGPVHGFITMALV